MDDLTKIVKVQIEFSIRFKKVGDEWWQAYSKYGSTSASSKEECIRILCEKAKGRHD